MTSLIGMTGLVVVAALINSWALKELVHKGGGSVIPIRLVWWPGPLRGRALVWRMLGNYAALMAGFWAFLSYVMPSHQAGSQRTFEIALSVLGPILIAQCLSSLVVSIYNRAARNQQDVPVT